MKHTSINCCDYGADFITTDPETGKVYAIQWSWAEVQAFIIKRGTDVTETMRTTLDSFMVEPEPGRYEVDLVPGKPWMRRIFDTAATFVCDVREEEVEEKLAELDKECT